MVVDTPVLLPYCVPWMSRPDMGSVLPGNSASHRYHGCDNTPAPPNILPIPVSSSVMIEEARYFRPPHAPPARTSHRHLTVRDLDDRQPTTSSCLEPNASLASYRHLGQYYLTRPATHPRSPDVTNHHHQEPPRTSSQRAHSSRPRGRTRSRVAGQAGQAGALPTGTGQLRLPRRRGKHMQKKHSCLACPGASCLPLPSRRVCLSRLIYRRIRLEADHLALVSSRHCNADGRDKPPSSITPPMLPARGGPRPGCRPSLEDTISCAVMR